MLAAYELLLEQLESEMEHINQQGSAAFRAGDYEQARALLAQVGELRQLQAQVQALEPALRRLVKPWPVPAAADSHRVKRRSLKPGLRTPESAYTIPILRALVKLGGRGSKKDVLQLVGREMQPRFTDYDLAVLPRDGRTIRWENAAAWCRLRLCQEGLLKTDSPSGIWEISEAGREWLKGQEEKT